MIERENYLDVRKFLDFQAHDLQSSPGTVENYRSRLRHLLEWADDKLLTVAHQIKPTYPAYLERITGPNGAAIGASQFAALCKTARAYFEWALKESPGRYRLLDANWIQSIRPPRARSEQAELKNRVLYKVEEVIQLANCQVGTTAERRAQAGAAFLFLSGMRITAFTSLPIACVDLEHNKVLQLPERGVLTKNRKAAVTTLLQVPELMRVVMEWDHYIRGQLPNSCLWYANLSRGGELTRDQPDAKALANRGHTFGDELRRLCALAGVDYKSAHKFRHGHIVYALKRCRTFEEFKAVSQNVMHSTTGITDGIYGNLVQDDVRSVILGLGADAPVATPSPAQDLQQLIELTLRKVLAEKG